MDPSNDIDSPGGDQRTRFFGKFRGTVSNNSDPLNKGRLRAIVPSVLQDVDTGWALPALPYAGDGVGVYTIPAVGASVWIEFEAGDVSLPIWTGCFWGDGELPKDETGSDSTPPRKIIRSEEGLLISLDDDAKTITLSDSDGNNLLKFTMQSGQIKMQAKTKVIVEAPQIELVESAPHPLVFGDDLLNYLNDCVMKFNTHLHPGETAAGFPVSPMLPQPMFQPATPALLSTKVKTG